MTSRRSLGLFALVGLACAGPCGGEPDPTATGETTEAPSIDPIEGASAELLEAFDTRDIDTMRRLLGEAVGYPPQSTEVSIALVDILLVLGARDEAEALLAELAGRPDATARLQIVHANHLARAGQCDRAYLVAAEARRSAAGSAPDATEGLVDAGLDVFEVPREAFLLTHEGMLDNDCGQLERAELRLRQAQTLAPTWVRPPAELGETMRRSGRFAEAEALYREALSLDAQDPTAHSNLGLVLVDHLCRPVEGFEHQQRAVELDPNHSTAWFNLATTSALMGQPKAAIAASERYLQLEPGASDADTVRFILNTMRTSPTMACELMRNIHQTQCPGLELPPIQAGGPDLAFAESEPVSTAWSKQLDMLARSHPRHKALLEALATPDIVELVRDSGGSDLVQTRGDGETHSFSAAAEAGAGLTVGVMVVTLPVAAEGLDARLREDVGSARKLAEAFSGDPRFPRADGMALLVAGPAGTGTWSRMWVWPMSGGQLGEGLESGTLTAKSGSNPGR